MALPLVSVVIPAYNAERWIAETIRSVLSQTFQEFEVIVVDDGSTDNTRQVVESFHDSRIRYVHQQNKGLSGARNAGIQLSCGSYIALLDADDLFKPDKLTKQVAVLESQPALGLVTCGFELINESGVQIGKEYVWHNQPIITLPNLLTYNPLLPSTLLIRRIWFEKAGLFDETLHRYEDWEFSVRLSLAGCQMDYVREMLVSYRRHATNISTAVHLVPVATEAAVQFMTRLFERNDLPENIRQLRPKVFGNLYLDAAARAYGAGLGEQGRSWLEMALEYDAELTSGNPPKWLNALSGHALTALVDNPKVYVNILAAYLPRYQGCRNWRERYLMAQIYAASAFKNLREGYRGLARVSAMYALVLDPSLLRNRGLLVLSLRPW